MNQKNFRIVICILSLLLPVFWAGCTMTQESEVLSKRFNSQLTLYLNGPEDASLDITFNLIAVNIIAEDGTAIEVTGRSHILNSVGLKGRQVLLGEKALPEGRYKKLQLIAGDASIKKKII